MRMGDGSEKIRNLWRQRLHAIIDDFEVGPAAHLVLRPLTAYPLKCLGAVDTIALHHTLYA